MNLDSSTSEDNRDDDLWLEDGYPDEDVRGEELEKRSPDPQQEEARAHLTKFFNENRATVFFSRQLEVRNEDSWFHWVTNRALHELVTTGLIRSEVQPLRTGGEVTLMWHRSYRYPRRAASQIVRLVEEYSDSDVGFAVGQYGELLVLEGFARKEFVTRGRNTSVFGSRAWTETAHDLDFIFERNEFTYGVEVKNRLPYMEYAELKVKMELCKHLQITPVFVVRMAPRSWIEEVRKGGGFTLILKYQLYPLAHKELAARMREDLGLPADAPRALWDGTMERFVRWHRGRGTL